MSELLLLAPELLVLTGALVALFADRVTTHPRAAAHIGAPLALVAAVVAAVIGTRGGIFAGMLSLDGMAVFARIGIAALLAVWLRWVSGRGTGSERSAEAVALAMLSAVGGMLMVSARDLIVLFISLELSTMPAYVLMGYRRDDARGLEGALKYFLLSMLTSLIMLYGLSFAYGISGSTAFGDLGVVDSGTLGQLAVAFVLVGLFAKLSAAPFHYWTPDAYAGAPASSVAYVSTVPKIAGVVALAQLVAAFTDNGGTVVPVLVAGSLLSMLVGNLAAYPQTDLRRLMAYSGVAHSGYILLAVASGRAGAVAAVFYVVAYAVPSMAIMLLGSEEGTALDDLSGLAARRPAVAWASVVWLLSLVGIPPMVGFFGKLTMFTAALDSGLLWLVIVAVSMSVISAGYYFRVLRAVFFGERADACCATRSPAAAVAYAALTLATLALGILASPVLELFGLRL
ncbi:MAG: NADH-quinone oxidoreductase subunit N [Coriobacteriia bacterium]|nr:NADH-quinone oxidoreductase subunit N [Coriobacteriia bacterium]MBN2847370.1 NADH-quinone oxidoreductase subunit N [Coriobacteriia bacterium]